VLRYAGAMAQWLGQFTGRTHATAAVDAEELLEGAIAAFRAATGANRQTKAKAVVRLAERLLKVRRRPLRARVEDQQALRGDSAAQGELQRLEDGGVAAILAEYGCPEALSAARPAGP
jgi:hypothetical protein